MGRQIITKGGLKLPVYKQKQQTLGSWWSVDKACLILALVLSLLTFVRVLEHSRPLFKYGLPPSQPPASCDDGHGNYIIHNTNSNNNNNVVKLALPKPAAKGVPFSFDQHQNSSSIMALPPLSPNDPSSFSNDADIRIKHVHLDWMVDFNSKTISGSVSHSAIVLAKEADQLQLDTSFLDIKSAWLVEKSGTMTELKVGLGVCSVISFDGV